MANTSIVTTETEAVNLVDTLEVIKNAAVEARTATFHASMARPNSLKATQALRAALVAETVATDAWKAATAVLQAMWRAEDAEYDAMLCAQYDAMDNVIDYPYGYDTSMPLPYTITSQGYTYLDHHYQTDSEAAQGAPVLAEGGESPYGDTTTGYVQPTPVPSYMHDGVTDMDELTRLENLSY